MRLVQKSKGVNLVPTSGDSKKAKVLQDLWLCDEQGSELSMSCRPRDEDMRVGELIVPGRAKSDLERLHKTSTSKDTKLVFGTPLSKRLHKDRLIWELNKSV